PPRDLHSFPTRRASDLAVDAKRAHRPPRSTESTESTVSPPFFACTIGRSTNDQSPFLTTKKSVCACASVTLSVAEYELVLPPCRSEEHTSELQSRSDLV